MIEKKMNKSLNELNDTNYNKKVFFFKIVIGTTLFKRIVWWGEGPP